MNVEASEMELSYQCQVCGHGWLPRKAQLPKWCPQCGSHNWATGRKRPPIAEQRARAAERKRAEAEQLLADLAQQHGLKTGAQMGQKDNVVESSSSFGGLQFLRPTENTDAAKLNLPKLPAVPCGPWKTALDEASEFPLQSELASLLDAREGDVLVPAQGQSMEESGVPDGALVLMRPLEGRKPASGEITLVMVETSDGEWVGTIKHWYQTRSRAVDLRDGKGHCYALPPNVKAVYPVAVLCGVIGRIGRR